ncbi:hypothetical protein B0919_23985 [Hymenobacter sp. CRA2]|nr:hypothetical protein B0919_23985 [Hymenobacter sp. CRA2]
MKFFQHRLKRYQSLLGAKTYDDLEEIVEDPDLVDRTLGFEVERQRMKEATKASILNYAHPTVWREMQLQHQSLRKIKQLFEDMPEALLWS